MHHTFSINESITFGWEKTRSHSGILFKVLLTLFAIQIAYSVVARVLENTLEGFFAMILLTLLSAAVGIGFTQIGLKIAKGESVTYSEIIPPFSLAWKYILASLLVGLITGIGFVLLIIPGIYFMLRFFFFRFAVLEGHGVMESLRVSTKMTEEIKWHLFLFFLALIGLNILGAIVFLVGLLVSIPVTLIAYAHVYNQLKSR